MDHRGELTREFIERIQVLAQGRDFGTLLDLLVMKYQEDWRTSPPEKAGEREHLYRMVAAVEALRKEVQAIAADELVTAYNRSLQFRTEWDKIQ